MTLLRLGVEGVRNLHVQEIELAAGINVFIGPNGSGKTSLLEACYLLIRGRSFRAALSSFVIAFNHSHLQIWGRLSQSGEDVPIGIRLGKSMREQRIAGSKIESSLAIMMLVPVQIIHPPTFGLLDASSRMRRQLIDWGVFHVEHAFLSVWRRYMKTLHQRNQLLRTFNYSQLDLWTTELEIYGEQVNALRADHVNQLQVEFDRLVALLLPDIPIEIKYHKGWHETLSLRDSLFNHNDRDKKQSVTNTGPHRADFKLMTQGRDAKTVLSRGQLKVAILALLFAQVCLIYRSSGKRVVLLMDDLASELDSHHLQRVIDLLQELKLQVLLTAVGSDPYALPFLGGATISVFHVEHGKIIKVG